MLKGIGFLVLLLSLSVLPSVTKAQTKVEIRLVPDIWGYDYCLGEFVAGFKEKEYHFIQSRKLSTSFFSWGLGLEVEINQKWKTRLRYGSSNNGIGYNYSYQHSISKRTSNGFSHSAGVLPSIGLRQKYKFWDKQFKKGYVKDFGLRLYGGIGTGYEYKRWYERSKDFVKQSKLSLYLVSSSYSKTVNNNSITLSAGIDIQVRYRKTPILEIGLWYEYALRHTEIYKFTYEDPYQSNLQDEVQFYPGRHTWSLYVHIPMIKLYSNAKHLQKRQQSTTAYRNVYTEV